MANGGQYNAFLDALKQGLAQAMRQMAGWFAFLRDNTRDTRHQLKETFYQTSDTVLEKAESARKSVKLRMSILEMEHNLNRLYPQIGKMLCDQALQDKKAMPKDETLRQKIADADEYRKRVDELKEKLSAHQEEASRRKG